MIKILFLLFFSGCVCYAQTSPIPDLPTDVDTWTDGQVFYGGMTCGFVVGASGFIVRFLRQPGKQNPEI